MSEKSQVPEMSSAVAEMAQLVRYAADPAVPGERVPHAIARAARRLGWSRSRVKAFWYGEARRIEAHEIEEARSLAAERARDVELLRDEYRRAIEIMARLEARLTRTDEDFFSPEINALRAGTSPSTGAGSDQGDV